MKIVTDSAADLTPQDLESYGITVAPLYIQFPDGEKISGELTHDDFYTRLEAMQPRVPTTAQPSAGNFVNLYQKILATGEEVISIHISSGLSGTLESARSGAAQVKAESVQIIDSMTLSGGLRFQVLAAARAVQAGWSFEKIITRLDRIRKESELIYTLDTLNYLARGGRIGRVQAVASALLNIKPLIVVDKADGKYSTVGKSRTITRALQDITNYLGSIYEKEPPLWVTVMHGKFEEKASQLAEMLKETLSIGKIEILRISPVLGVHTGPSIVGAAVAPMHLLEIFS